MINTSCITMAAAIVATLLVLAASAPLGVHERNTREVSQEDILFNISVGLGVLRNSSILELMGKMNLTAVTPCNIADAAHNRFKTALDITCDLYHAKTKILPNIVNNRTTTKVVKTLNTANLKDSCLWLEQEANELLSGEGEEVHYCTEEGITVEHICKRWSSINKFDATRDSLKVMVTTPIDSAAVQTWLESNQPEAGWMDGGDNLADRLSCS